MARRLMVPRIKIDVIPRGRDPMLYPPADALRRRRTRESLGWYDQPVVLAVARHEFPKGLDLLLRAVARLPPASSVNLVIAGRRGAETAALERLAVALGLSDSIRYLGPRDDVPDLLSAADLFVLPSPWEGLPNALIEAMAVGTPIVAADIPPVREVLGQRFDAILVPVGSPDALARGITAALENRDRIQFSVANRRRFEARFSIDSVATQMVAFYDRARQ
jgi:glycosyltransferase involved in cell wall biosynthesis